MRVTLDACVIFPSVLRAILMRAARAGLYEPVWSDRILEESQRAIPRLGPQAVQEAALDAARMREVFPRALTPARPEIEARHILPDPNDLHVLAVAISSGADAIITFNASDFPGHVLAAEGVQRRDPDGFLWQLWSHHPTEVEQVVADVQAVAERMSGGPVSRKALLKRVKLNRFAKAIGAAGL